MENVLDRKDAPSHNAAGLADSLGRALTIKLLVAFTSETGTLRARLFTTFSWLNHLDHSDQETCLAEMIYGARASLAAGRPDLVEGMLLSWKETAAALADGLLPAVSD